MNPIRRRWSAARAWALLLVTLQLCSCHNLFPSGPTIIPQSDPSSPRLFTGTVSDAGGWPTGANVEGILAPANRSETFGSTPVGVLASEGGVQMETGLPLRRASRILVTTVPSFGVKDLSHYMVAAVRQEAELGAQTPGSKSTLTVERAYVGHAAAPVQLELQDELDAPLASIDLTILASQLTLGPLGYHTILHAPWLADELLASLPSVQDERFFGSYLTENVTLDLDGPQATMVVELSSMALHLRHVGAEIPSAAGSLWGGGEASVANLCDLIDHPDCGASWAQGIVLGIAGEVSSTGVARLLLTGYLSAFRAAWKEGNVPQPVAMLVTATLSADGETLSLHGLGGTIALHKLGAKLRRDDSPQFSPNVHPQVSIVSPPDGAVLPFGVEAVFAADVQDPNLPHHPPTHSIRWERRSGMQWVAFGETVSGSGASDRSSVAWTPLDAGEHDVRVIVVDAGGLRASDTITIQTTSRSPFAPEILMPQEGAQVVAGIPILFRGRGYDPDEGPLVGESLQWFYTYPSGPLEMLGASNVGIAPPDFAFPQPGEVDLHLVATDADGQSASTVRRVVVLPSGSNSPPEVLIESPNTVLGPFVARRGKTSTFSGRATDVEDPQNVRLEWTVTLQGEPPIVLGDTSVVTWTPPVEGPTDSGGLKPFELRLTAADSSGLTSSQSIQMILWPADFYVE